MARNRRIADLSGRAAPGATFAVRVTPRAAFDALEAAGDAIAIRVTAPPEAGRATAAAAGLLAEALGVAPGRLRLLRGAASREKLFRLD